MQKQTNDPRGNTAYYLCSTIAFITSVSIRAGARSCAFVYSGGKNSLVPHTHTSLFLLSRCEDEAYKKT
jgi:hypothetical protein